MSQLVPSTAAAASPGVFDDSMGMIRGVTPETRRAGTLSGRRWCCEHLDQDARVKLGAFYTPQDLVEKVRDFVAPYVRRVGTRSVIVDTAAGYGAFVEGWTEEVRAVEIDAYAVGRLQEVLPTEAVIHANAIQQPTRDRIGVADSDRLIVVGNPPYNDTTSAFRNGRKGRSFADPELADRDLGISFLRSYDRLRADVVCVLHPLSYLIKEANFRRLKSFREHYRLRRGVLFSSERFGLTGASKFPVVIALYERGEGMDYETLREFEFELLDAAGVFRLGDFETTDGLINKYPPRSKDSPHSEIGVYYYTFRDINSLKRNAGFMGRPDPNGIVVNRWDFHRYAYLHAFKRLFAPAKPWLYGNLSPLVDSTWLEEAQRDLVQFALTDHPLFVSTAQPLCERLAADYRLDWRIENGAALRHKLAERINRLARV